MLVNVCDDCKYYMVTKVYMENSDDTTRIKTACTKTNGDFGILKVSECNFYANKYKMEMK